MCRCSCIRVFLVSVLCVCWQAKASLCSSNHRTSPPPHIHHNKEQLNAAALPAEEPTASRTSTNRQICLKPKGRSNKSQPTECKPLASRPTDSNQRTCWLLHRDCSGRLLSDELFYMKIDAKKHIVLMFLFIRM